MTHQGPLPFVGIPCDLRQIGIHPMHVVGEKYINAVAHGAGVMPMLMPCFGEGDDLEPLENLYSVDDLLDRVDGVFLPGSPSNVGPHHYGGHDPRPDTLQDPQRDALTLPMIRRIVERGIPLFAVCRGIQELNAALGGTLFQHVEEQPGRMDHRENKDDPREKQYGPAHSITVTPGGVLHGITGLETYEINSIHGQGVDQPAERLSGRGRCARRPGRGGFRQRRALPAAGRAMASGMALPRTQARPRPFHRLWRGLPRLWRGPPCRLGSLNQNGVFMSIDPESWLREHGINEIECMVADLTGMPRGKILPRDRFLRALTDKSLRMPGDVFYQTVTGEYPEPYPGDETSPDMILYPDVETLRRVPWYDDPNGPGHVPCHLA